MANSIFGTKLSSAQQRMAASRAVELDDYLEAHDYAYSIIEVARVVQNTLPENEFDVSKIAALNFHPVSGRDTAILSQPEGTYWHFLPEDLCFGYQDGRKVIIGETLTEDGELEICAHVSRAPMNVLDELDNASSSVVCLVKVSGEVIKEGKTTGHKRTILWMGDVTPLLYEFSCNVAEKVLLDTRESGHEPHPALFTVIEGARHRARGEFTRQESSDSILASTHALMLVLNGAHWHQYAHSAVMATMRFPAEEAAQGAVMAAMDMRQSKSRKAERTKLNTMLTSMLMAEYDKEKQS